MRESIKAGIATLIGSLLILVVALPAMAQEIGTGLLCNTQAQVEKVVALTQETHSLQATLAVVNAETPDEKNVCGVATVAYIKGKTVKAGVRSIDGVRDIVEITVVGYVVNGLVVFLPPTIQYTLFASKGEDI